MDPASSYLDSGIILQVVILECSGEQVFVSMGTWLMVSDRVTSVVGDNHLVGWLGLEEACRLVLEWAYPLASLLAGSVDFFTLAPTYFVDQLLEVDGQHHTQPLAELGLPPSHYNTVEISCLVFIERLC